jgi:hypothetical protein
MKTTTIIIAAILTLQSAILFAGNDNIATPVINEISSFNLTALAPSTPVEATFEDMAMMNEMTTLIPVTPAEATFEEMPADMISLVLLAPLTPVTADFNDTADSFTIDPSTFAPLTPATADFE